MEVNDFSSVDDALYQIGYKDGQAGKLKMNTSRSYLMGHADGIGDIELDRFKNNPTLRTEWQDPKSGLKRWHVSDTAYHVYKDAEEKMRGVDRLFKKKPQA